MKKLFEDVVIGECFFFQSNEENATTPSGYFIKTASGTSSNYNAFNIFSAKAWFFAQNTDVDTQDMTFRSKKTRFSDLEPGDKFLLCGKWEYLKVKKIEIFNAVDLDESKICWFEENTFVEKI